MVDHIEVVVCSRVSNIDNRALLTNISETCGYNCHVNYVINDGSASLTKVYNDKAKEHLDKETIIVYMHDDIEFLRGGWGFYLARMFEEHKDYSIIGVAGTKQFTEEGFWWHRDKKYGQVLHRHEGKAWLTAFSPLLDHDLEEVCVVDGLFFAVDTARVSKWFNEKYDGFHHYDTSFCLANYIDGKYKIGVTTNIRVAHNSIGATTDKFMENLQKLNDEFGQYYPIDVDNDKNKRDNTK